MVREVKIIFIWGIKIIVFYILKFNLSILVYIVTFDNVKGKYI